MAHFERQPRCAGIVTFKERCPDFRVQRVGRRRPAVATRSTYKTLHVRSTRLVHQRIAIITSERYTSVIRHQSQQIVELSRERSEQKRLRHVEITECAFFKQR